MRCRAARLHGGRTVHPAAVHAPIGGSGHHTDRPNRVLPQQFPRAATESPRSLLAHPFGKQQATTARHERQALSPMLMLRYLLEDHTVKKIIILQLHRVMDLAMQKLVSMRV